MCHGIGSVSGSGLRGTDVVVVSESIAGARGGTPKGRSRPIAPDAGTRSHLENSLIFFFYSRIDACDALTFRTRWAIYMRAMFALALERSS